MSHPILPKLKPNHNVKNIPDVGKWEVRTRDALDKLSSGLKVDRIETEISSIPDMWARPMLFEMALYNQQHVLHERLLGEWRGLLAMLALKEVVGLSRLTAAQVTLPAAPAPFGDGEQREETEVEQRNFLRTLSKLLPKSSLSSDTSWRTLYVFLFNGQPIGMTSPTTLVVTGADYLNRISAQDVGWYNGTHLKDPVRVLPPRQREILAGWLDTLRNQIGQHQGLNVPRWNLLSGLLGNFVRDLGPGACTLSKSGYDIHGQEAGVFKYLDKPADGNIPDASHVRLIPSEGRTSARPLFVFERGIAEQWNMLPQDVTVEGAQTLASARTPTSKTADVWREADFFTKKLFVIAQESAFLDTPGTGHQSLTMPGGSNVVTPILPLRPELMQYLTVEELSRSVHWDQTPEGLKLRLFLRLSGPDLQVNDGRTVELSKLFRREDIQTLDRVPILEVWPNFRAPGWRAYYTCYSADNVAETFIVKPSTPAPAVESEVSPGGRALRRYWRTETFPDAMVCRASVPNTQTNRMEEHDAGLLLLTTPQESPARGALYRVGVDFGATSTTICARAGAEQPFIVNFQNRKIRVTASGDIARAKLFDFFLPERASEMPVLSFFDDFHNHAAGKDNELIPFLHGHAYLLETAELFDPLSKELDYDLKWSPKAEDRLKVRAFLTQLALQAAAELADRGAAGVRWAFSYPTAFNEDQMDEFQIIWKQVAAECAAQSGFRLEGKGLSQTESIATALYFVNKQNATPEPGTIFIDIGGSTSDISIWQGNKPVWQTSLLLAGRDIFSNYLWHRPDFLGLFDVDVSRLMEVKSNFPTDRKRYYAYADALLRYNNEKIFRQLPINAGTEQVKALRQHLALGVSGLFYYVGSLLRYLTEAGIYKREVPNVHIGGNGSRIFRWLDIAGEGRINALYKATFSQGAGWKDDQSFRVVLSPEPKMEAAYGLVYESNTQGGNPEKKVLAGESFVAEETTKDWPGPAALKGDAQSGPRLMPWNTVLTPEAFTLTLAAPQKLDRLTDFVETFNKFAGDRGLVSMVSLSGEEVKDVRQQLAQSLSRYRGVKEKANVLVEPVFIMALRHWLEIRLGR
jgi:hypothetical protein